MKARLLLSLLLAPLASATYADVVLICSYTVDTATNGAELIAMSPQSCATLVNNGRATHAEPPTCPDGYDQYSEVQYANLSASPATRRAANGMSVPVIRAMSEARRVCLKSGKALTKGSPPTKAAADSKTSGSSPILELQ